MRSQYIHDGVPDASAYAVIHEVVKRRLPPEQWQKLITRIPGGTVKAVQRRVVGMFYHVALGWTVIPAAYPLFREGRPACSCHSEGCGGIGKHPCILWDMTNMPEPPGSGEILSWLCHYSGNFAVLGGERSGNLIIGDVDPRHGGRLETLWEMGWPENTPIEKTGGGGWHVYTWSRNSFPSIDNYVEGIEVKADGKLVIAAPSLHVSGNHYEWLDGHAPWEIAVARLPKIVEGEAQAHTAPRTFTGSAHTAADDDGNDDLGALAHSEEDTLTWAQRFYYKALHKVRMGEGRNNTGFWLGSQLDALGFTRSEVVAWVVAFGREANNG